MPHSTNYVNTLIRPSPDCKADSAFQPINASTIAGRHFALIFPAPYEWTSDDVIVTVQADRKAIAQADRDAFRAEFFSRGQPCLRCSPLVKTHGWAFHHDAAGRVALVDPASATFTALIADPDLRIVDGMRQSRR